MGQEILAQSGVFTPLGYRWVDRFLTRHERVKTKKSVLLERSRTRGSTRERYEDFFGRLRTQIDTKKIAPCNIANMDEHGMQEVETRSGTVIGDSLTNRAVVTAPDSTNWVTVIEAITAEGRRLTPAIVFTGASLQGQWYPKWVRDHEDIRDWKYGHSPTGWSNAQNAIK
jgi:4-hydroxybenzoate polyprenyltransferase